MAFILNYPNELQVSADGRFSPTVAGIDEKKDIDAVHFHAMVRCPFGANKKLSIYWLLRLYTKIVFLSREIFYYFKNRILWLNFCDPVFIMM